MEEFEVWSEGYAATGEHGTAQFLGKYKGIDFKDACMKMMLDQKWEIDKFYSEKYNTYWGCKFYDNEKDARKHFG